MNVDVLTPVLCLSPSRFDLHGKGFRVVEFHGPYGFVWSRYDTLEP